MEPDCRTSIEALMEFYQETGERATRRSPEDEDYYTLHQLENVGYSNLESWHKYIQWLFPTNEKSDFNTNAPILQNEADIEAFRNNPIIQYNLQERAFPLMMDFYGFVMKKEEGGRVVINRAEHFEARRNNFFKNRHNSLRITRILKCLCIFTPKDGEGKKRAQAFYEALDKVAYEFQEHENGGEIFKTCQEYWKPVIDKHCRTSG